MMDCMSVHQGPHEVGNNPGKSEPGIRPGTKPGIERGGGRLTSNRGIPGRSKSGTKPGTEPGTEPGAKLEPNQELYEEGDVWDRTGKLWWALERRAPRRETRTKGGGGEQNSVLVEVWEGDQEGMGRLCLPRAGHQHIL